MYVYIDLLTAHNDEGCPDNRHFSSIAMPRKRPACIIVIMDNSRDLKTHTKRQLNERLNQAPQICSLLLLSLSLFLFFSFSSTNPLKSDGTRRTNIVRFDKYLCQINEHSDNELVVSKDFLSRSKSRRIFWHKCSEMIYCLGQSSSPPPNSERDEKQHGL